MRNNFYSLKRVLPILVAIALPIFGAQAQVTTITQAQIDKIPAAVKFSSTDINGHHFGRLTVTPLIGQQKGFNPLINPNSFAQKSNLPITSKINIGDEPIGSIIWGNDTQASPDAAPATQTFETAHTVPVYMTIKAPRNESTAPQYNLTVTQEPGGTKIKVDFGGYTLCKVQTGNGGAYVVEFKGGHPMLQKGMPDVVQLTLPILIDNTGNTQVAYYDVQYTDVLEVDIAPSKGNLKRTVDPSEVPYFKGDAYTKDEFFPATNAELGKPYIMRDCRGQALYIHPFQYNPVTHTLRVITSITLKVMNIGGAGFNELANAATHPDDEFTAIYQNHFVNFGVKEKATTAPTPVGGDLLIIADPAFMAAMQPYVNWKIRKGIKTEMVSVASVGNTSTAIKAYIANYYTTHNLSYVLLVGDLAQVTSPTQSGGKSDPSYGYLTGTDSYPEVIIGRFSAENVTHVTTQVAKVLKYEITPPTGNTRFDHTTHIASNEGPGDNNEMDWQHERIMKDKLMAFTYTDHSEYYDDTHPAGGNDAAGNPSSNDVVNATNAGTGIINYTGHGSTTSWATTGFSNGNISSLTNTAIWPFIWSVGCVNGEFDNGTCFGEAWARATYNGQPVGAIASFMSSINQSWSPPMAGQDGMVDILAGNINPGNMRSFGGISTNGCVYMNDVYGSAGAEMTDTWHCFGDPTILVRTADPLPLVATHAPNILIGATEVVVTCNVEGALVAISQNHTLLGKAFVSGGVATVTIPALNAPDSVFVTATDFNYTPYLSQMLVGASVGPYVTLNSHLVDDATENNNTLPDFGESDGINISLNNIGAVATGPLTVKLRSNNPYVTITDSVYTAGSIAAQAITAVSPAFGITISNSVPDQTAAAFDVFITDGTNSWTSNFNLLLNAPVLTIPTLTVTELQGNGNGRLEAGETATITYSNLNAGHADALLAQALLYGGDSYVSVTSANIITIPNAAAATAVDAVFTLSLAANTPVNHYVPFEYTLSKGSYIATYNMNLKVNMLVEDFATGDFSAHDWQSMQQIPWVVDDVTVYEGPYSSKSGDVGDDEMTVMQLSVNVFTNDSIAFYRKVSSEEGYDYLSFYIDGDLYAQWSGEVAWGRVAFPMYSGPRMFAWIYKKDNVYDGGEDAAWVDFIELPNSSAVTGLNTPTATDGVIKAYPNPSNGITTLLVDTKSNNTATVEVYNTQGQLIYTERLAANQKQTTLNTAAWAIGLYNVVVRSDKGMLNTRLVVR